MKKKGLLLLAAGMTVLLGGCSMSREADTTTISVDKKGIVTETIVEGFEKEYYSANELEGSIRAAVAEYNSAAGAEAVTLDSFEENTEAKTLRTKLVYTTAEDFTQMNGRTLFAGTVSGAHQAGYEFGTMTAKADGQSVEASAVLEMGEAKLVAVAGEKDNPVNVSVPGKISHVSDGVAVADDRTAVIPGQDGTFYIIYK